MIKRRTVRTLGLAAAVTLSLMACGSNVLGPDPTDAEFAESLGIDLDLMTETASGLFIRDDVVGTGPAAVEGDIAVVIFTGWIADGTVFDEGTFTFTIGPAGAIPGFVEGVTGMQVGGMRTIVVPAPLAYGSDGRGSVPADAVLIFSLHLTSLP